MSLETVPELFFEKKQLIPTLQQLVVSIQKLKAITIGWPGDTPMRRLFSLQVRPFP